MNEDLSRSYGPDFSIPCFRTDSCTDPENKKEYPYPNCKKYCHSYLKLSTMFNCCGMPHPEQYLRQVEKVTDKITLEKLNKVKNDIWEFVLGGNNLLIMGEKSGSGKTAWALKLMYAYFFTIWSETTFAPHGYFLYIPKFLTDNLDFDYRKTSEYANILEIIRTVPIVIWDDLYKNPIPPNMQLLLDSTISERMRDRKTNLITGLKIPPEKVIKNVGENLAEKIFNIPTLVLKGDK